MSLDTLLTTTCATREARLMTKLQDATTNGPFLWDVLEVRGVYVGSDELSIARKPASLCQLNSHFHRSAKLPSANPSPTELGGRRRRRWPKARGERPCRGVDRSDDGLALEAFGGHFNGPRAPRRPSTRRLDWMLTIVGRCKAGNSCGICVYRQACPCTHTHTLPHTRCVT